MRRIRNPLAIHITYGKFRTAHLGDLTKNKEFELMCPNNRIGTVDVLLGLHHGQASSNSEVLVNALRPRVAIMNNGTRKGGEPDVMKTVHSSPGLEDLWQLHFSVLSGQEYTVPGMFIANTIDEQQATIPVAPVPAPPPGPGAPPARYITARPTGSNYPHSRMVPSRSPTLATALPKRMQRSGNYASRCRSRLCQEPEKDRGVL